MARAHCAAAAALLLLHFSISTSGVTEPAPSEVLRLPSVYVYPMPSEFNTDLLHKIRVGKLTEPWLPDVDALQANGGLGPRLAPGTFDGYAYPLEYLYWHRLMHHYPKRVHNPDEAELLWVPYWPMFNAIAHRDDRAAGRRLEEDAFAWLREHAPLLASEPHRHVLALGKAATEFLGFGNAVYGNALLRRREMAGVQALSIEADPGEQLICTVSGAVRSTVAVDVLHGRAENVPPMRMDAFLRHLHAGGHPCVRREHPKPPRYSRARVVGVPYLALSSYEPGAEEAGRGEAPGDEPVPPWLDPDPAACQAPRPLLAAFAGAENRSNIGLIMQQRTAAVRSCREWAGGKRGAEGSCLVEPQTDRLSLRRAYANATFCLQPPGDTATRSGLFDSVVCGCVPVVWSADTLEGQYPLHLPRPWEAALLVPPEHADDVLPWLASLVQREPERVAALRSGAVAAAARCQYSLRGARPARAEAEPDAPWDALEHALAGVGRIAAGIASDSDA